MRKATVFVVMLAWVFAMPGWGSGPAQARPVAGQTQTLTLVASETLALSYYDGETTRISPSDGHAELLFGNAPAASGPAWLRDYGLQVTDTTTGTVYLRSYVRFPLVTLPPHSQVQSAYLRLHVTDCAPLSPTSTVQSFSAGVYPLLGNWSEETLTAWSDTNPAYPIPAAATTTIARGGTGQHTWDVTGIVAGWASTADAQPGFLLSSSPAPDDRAGLVARVYNRIGAEPPTLVVTYVQRTPPVLREPVYAGARKVRGTGGPGEAVDVRDVDTGAMLGAGVIGGDGAFVVKVNPALVVDQRIQAHSDELDSNVVVVQTRPATEIPEWPTVILMGSGLAGLWAWLRRRRE